MQSLNKSRRISKEQNDGLLINGGLLVSYYFCRNPVFGRPTTTKNKDLHLKSILGETSCPYQIRSTSNPQKERKRFPDAIGIGIAKSGTGSIAFLDCHSQIRFRALEPSVFKANPFEKQFFSIQHPGDEILNGESFPLDAEDVYSDHFPFTYGPLEGTIEGDKVRVVNRFIRKLIFEFECVATLLKGGFLIPEATDDEFLIEVGNKNFCLLSRILN